MKLERPHRRAALLLSLLGALSCADPGPSAEGVDASMDAGGDDLDVIGAIDEKGDDASDAAEDVAAPPDAAPDSAPDAVEDAPLADAVEDAPTDIAPDLPPDVVEDAPVADAPVEDTPADAPDDPGVTRASAWRPGVLSGVPPRAELLALPGGGVGEPVLVSNNPEIFEGDGLLYGNARPSPTRGGQPWPLSGEFGVYLHHVNRAASPRYVTLLVTNPNNAPVTVTVRGSGYTQTETGGLGLGVSPDYRVSREWIVDAPTTVVGPTAIQPFRPLVGWQRRVNVNAEVDGRFAVTSTLPVYVYVVATSTSDVNEAVQDVLIDAPGDYRASGTPPPPFGREAGVYAHDTWQGAWRVEVPEGPGHVAFMVNTATGGGLSPVQAFPALAHYDQSAAEAVGMYGNVYDLRLTLVPVGSASPRRVRVTFSSLATGNASRWWDGVGLLDGREIVIRHVPGSVTTTLLDATLSPDAPREVHLRAMVPGLTSIPQALAVEVF